MDNQNLNVLDEINKGATMGMDAISFISQKVEDNQFKNILKQNITNIKIFLLELINYIIILQQTKSHTKLTL